MSVVTADELWNLVEAAWADEPLHTTHSLFDSMPRCTAAAIVAGM